LVARFLDGAFTPDRAAAVVLTEGVAAEAVEGPVAGTGDEISSTTAARLAAGAVLVVGFLLVVFVLDEKPVAFKPAEGFELFTGFYIATQAIERLLELIPAGLGSKQAKANRAVIFPALGFLLAVLLAEKLGLYFVHAAGVTDLSKEWDVIITALAIGGGTKPLHDAIKRIEKAKETPPLTT
jgi:hypothetical protein